MLCIYAIYAAASDRKFTFPTRAHATHARAYTCAQNKGRAYCKSAICPTLLVVHTDYLRCDSAAANRHRGKQKAA